MKLQLKISQRGLIIVAVPLLLEFILLISLASLLHQAEIEIQQEAHSKEVVMHANILLRQLIAASTNLVAFTLNKNTNFLRSSRGHMWEVNAEISKLRVLLHDQPEQLARVERTQKDVQRLYVVLRKIETVSHQPMGFVSFLRGKEFFDEMHDILDQVAEQDIDPLLIPEQRIMEAGPAVRARNRQEIQGLIYGGVALTIFLAFYLTSLFSKGISKRLQYLTDNTGRLAKKLPLSPPMEGSDEIATLDQVFHEMADALAEAARKEREIQELRQVFVQMVSHDLRTPLTSVLTFLNMLSQGNYGEIAPKTRAKAQTQEHNIERLISLINDLLDLEKIESGVIHLKLAPVSIRLIIGQSVEAVRALADSSRINIVQTGGDLVITADGDRLVQVVTNLLSNAIKFSPPDSSITVSLIEDPAWIEVRIKDCGPGISARHREVIFERFQQLESPDGVQRGGTGLGLAICKTIVEQHGGSIGVDSEEGKGSEFWFRLPRIASNDELSTSTASS